MSAIETANAIVQFRILGLRIFRAFYGIRSNWPGTSVTNGLCLEDLLLRGITSDSSAHNNRGTDQNKILYDILAL